MGLELVSKHIEAETIEQLTILWKLANNPIVYNRIVGHQAKNATRIEFDYILFPPDSTNGIFEAKKENGKWLLRYYTNFTAGFDPRKKPIIMQAYKLLGIDIEKADISIS